MTVIPSAELQLGQLPPPGARWEELERFALTFDGYAAFGNALGELASRHRDAGTVPTTVDELRGCLFLEQRSWRHVGGLPDERAMAHFHALVEGIRLALAPVPPGLFEQLERVAWSELLHQGFPRVSATNVPLLLRALAAHGPNYTVSSEANPVGSFGRPTELRVPRSVASELNALMRVSPVTPKLVPFILELLAARVDLPTRRLCVRWLQSFFKHCTIGHVTATFDLEAAERGAAWVARVGLPKTVLDGAPAEREDPALGAAFDALQTELGEGVNVVWALEGRLGDVWKRDTWNALVAGLDTLLSALASGDESLCAEVIALVSWLPQRAELIAPRLRALAAEPGLLSTMALLALARLQQPGVAEAILVKGDSLESRGEKGAAAIYLAAADVLASKGQANAKSRRALLKVAPEDARLPDPFSSTLAELVKTVAALLVWPGR